jgi:alpha-mannosidase
MSIVTSNAPQLTPVEEAIRARLGVPATATNVFIMSQSAHLDWDWMLTFPDLYYQTGQPKDVSGYFTPGVTEPASQIFSDAATFLAGSPAYYYSICEMGFLQAFCTDARFSTQAQALRAAPNFQTVGGGITSPDNLITHSEAFIRNYLTGWAFVAQTFTTMPKLQAWLPDDFGHDSELPALLAAMGMQGVAFQRVPGEPVNPEKPVDGTPSVAAQLQLSGVDFVWTARDGSSVLAHWLSGGYCQGDGIFDASQPVESIAQYLSSDENAKLTTPYLFLPVGCDFREPQALPSAALQWNQQEWATGNSPYYVVCATFDDFVQLVAEHRAALPVQPMYATPYWTGFYATRPDIKQGHHDSTRALLAAETFDQLVPGASHGVELAAAWSSLAPTTHHDFIPGTSSVHVYLQEQQPILAQVQTAAAALIGDVLGAVAPEIGASPQAGEIAFAVFNPLGTATQRLIEVPSSIGSFAGVNSVRAGSDRYPVQLAADGGLLFVGAVPSAGYTVFYLSPEAPTVTVAPVTVELTTVDVYLLQNEALAAIVDPASGNLTVVNDLLGPSPEANLLGAPANAIVIYTDSGDNYQLGCEQQSGTFTPQPTGAFSAGGATILENGPLRCGVSTTLNFQANGTQYAYEREYWLVAGEPFVRMSLTGALPTNDHLSPGSSLVVEFPLANTIAALCQGTTSHWTDQQQVFYWEGPSFQATRDYVIASDGAGPQGAIYHGSVPAWGLNAYGGTNVLSGCLMRNTAPSWPDHWYESEAVKWGGIDPQSHTLEYAFRVPTGIAAPETGQAMLEARTYTTDVYVAAVGESGTRPPAQSLAWAQSPTGVALVAALKAGTFDPTATFVRVYDPSNVAANSILLNLDGLIASQGGGSFSVQLVTALEQPIAGQDAYPYDAGGVTFAAQGAITTVKITPV